MKRTVAVATALLLILTRGISVASAATALDTASIRSLETRIVNLLGELVAADTTNPPGNEARAVALIEKRWRAMGIDFKTQEFAPGRKNIVARLRGDGSKKPLLLIAHLDVVGVEGQDWTTDPHRLTIRDGYYYGRGVIDDLGAAAAFTELLGVIRDRKLPLARDLVVALTGDEESGGAGVKAIFAEHPEWIDAEIALNEGGYVVLNSVGKVTSIELQKGEKTYADFEILAKGTTGHSSIPRKDNAIYKLSAALDRLSKFRFPMRLTASLREYLAESARHQEPALARAMNDLAKAGEGRIPARALSTLEENPTLAATVRTTCVATLVHGGNRANSLPADARATVNCRILPDEDPAAVKVTLEKVLADASLTVTQTKDFGRGPVSPSEGVVPDAVKKVAAELWPQANVIPTIMRGATDSRFLRQRGILAYGLQPFPYTQEDARRPHGIDERLPVSSIPLGIDFLYRLITKLAER
jgi:acetylornithine deacetylase/succinyl-diaminopimelate desuccinylase-like protein